MSIATRIEAIEQHITDDYGVLTLAGADLTNVNKNILNLKQSWQERLLYFMNNGTSVVWNNWNKVSGTGTTLSLNNTEEAPMSLVYKGNTSQSGTPTPSSPIPVQVVSGDNSIEVSNGTQSASYPITLPEGMFLGWIPNTTYQDKIDKSTGKNIFSSNTWRKVYTGNGYPVPNTSVDVTITSSDTNNISFNIGQTYSGIESDFIPVKANEEYTLSFKQATNINRLFVTQYDSNKNRIGTINANVTIIEGKTFTTTNDGYIAVAFTSTSAVNNVVISLVQIEKGNTATPYEPYGTGWYLKKEIGKVVLNGTESWYQWGTDTFYITKLSSVRTGLSNYFKYNSTVTGASQLNNGEFFIHDNTNNNVVIFRNTSYTTVADFKTWLSTHNTEVLYVLDTPTYETITDTTLINQLEALKKSYEEQTNISQTNNDLPFELSVTALGELV